ncbi:MAG: FAD:protein FMN transferase [Alphaproteobacteria bacterium]|nr:FAD:protein FMN transferase [Alphaproteobacteria bacterium]
MRPGRRRVLGILACGLGLGLGGGLLARPRARAATLEWRGVALGAEARILLRHAVPEKARAALAAVQAEIERLENEFSLYRPHSAVSRLNRDGRLPRPSLDLRRLLLRAAHFSAITAGAFDATIQPLWLAVAEGAQGGIAPEPGRIEAARRLVDWRALDIGPAELRFARPGMAITLNGIAQGYITDRVTGLLLDHGMGEVLVDAGELRAGAATARAAGWRVGVSHPGRAELPLTLRDGGLATSAGAGSRFTADGAWHHIIDPRSATCPPAARAATVLAPTATDADALSTALALAPPQAGVSLLEAAGAARAILSEPGEARARQL